MFRIPAHNLMSEMTFEEAKSIISRLGVKSQSLLDGLEYMDNMWNEHCFNEDEDDDFYDTWIYEVNAFNVVFNKMQPLFAGK